MDCVSFEIMLILINVINLLNENTNLYYFLVCEFRKHDKRQEIEITCQNELKHQQNFKFNYNAEKVIDNTKLYAIDSYDYATLLFSEEY